MTEEVGSPSTLALATKNPGKIKEILQICRNWPVRWVTFDQASQDMRALWPEVTETGTTYLENALLKARALSAALGIPAVADDSGIEVDALGGGPGPRSARFAGDGATDQENLRLLLDSIWTLPRKQRTARYRCVAAYVKGEGGEETWAEGSCEGVLISEPRGAGGFGYDPIFVPRDAGGVTTAGRTMAELDPDEKNAISHRGRAF